MHSPYMTTGKTIALTRWTFVSKMFSLFFNILSRFVLAFLPRSKRLLISWLQSLSAVILEPKKVKSLTVFIMSPSICHEVMGPDSMCLVFLMWVFSQLFHSPLSPSSRSSLVPLHFIDISSAILIPACASSSLAFHMMYSASISRLTIYSLDVFISQFGTNLLFHVQF